MIITSTKPHKVGKFLISERKPLNSSDRYAVLAILKDDVVIGHLPRQLSRILLARNCAINCIIIGGRCSAGLASYYSKLP